MDNLYDRPPQRTTPPTDFDKAIAEWVARNKCKCWNKND